MKKADGVTLPGVTEALNTAINEVKNAENEKRVDEELTKGLAAIEIALAKAKLEEAKASAESILEHLSSDATGDSKSIIDEIIKKLEEELASADSKAELERLVSLANAKIDAIKNLTEYAAGTDTEEVAKALKEALENVNA